MYIGELAKKSGASRKAIYLYEQMSLIQQPVRKGSYRVYASVVVDQIQTIRCAQALGFKLRELVDALADDTEGASSGVAFMLERIRLKRQAIQAQIDTAQAQLKLLNEFEGHLLNSADSIQCEILVDSSPKGRL